MDWREKRYKFALSPNVSSVEECMFTINHKDVYTYTSFWDSLKTDIEKH